jgi:hypothetical protein
MITETITEKVRTANSLSEVEASLVVALQESRRNTDRLGYVSGIITSDGPENIGKNIKLLSKRTEILRSQHSFPLFSATDVFNDEVFAKINAHEIPTQGWLSFWRNVLSSGHVSHVIMTPRWELSTGALDEFDTARRLGLTIEYFKDNQH